MSYIAIVLTSVFSANALLVYGLGVCPTFRREHHGLGLQMLALAFINILASGLFWLARTFVLVPFALQSIDVIFYAVVITPLLKYLSRFIASVGSQPLVRIGAAMDEAVTSCLVFGVALIVTRSDYSFLEAIIASAGACLGYWLALVILGSIRDRLEFSNVPAAFRGAPALLISAGLMAMAFLGIDETLIRNLAR
jgi:electron transport complex protein RnfA